MKALTANIIHDQYRVHSFIAKKQNLEIIFFYFVIFLQRILTGVIILRLKMTMKPGGGGGSLFCFILEIMHVNKHSLDIDISAT